MNSFYFFFFVIRVCVALEYEYLFAIPNHTYDELGFT